MDEQNAIPICINQIFKKHGIKLGFYYSQTQDWYESDAYGNDWDFDPEQADFDKYLNKNVKPQLTELLTNYGETARRCKESGFWKIG